MLTHKTLWMRWEKEYKPFVFTRYMVGKGLFASQTYYDYNTVYEMIKTAMGDKPAWDLPAVVAELRYKGPLYSYYYLFNSNNGAIAMVPIVDAAAAADVEPPDSAFKRVYDGLKQRERQFAFLNIIVQMVAIDERIGYGLFPAWESPRPKGVCIRGPTRQGPYNWDDFAPLFADFTETQILAIADLTKSAAPKTMGDIDAMFPHLVDTDVQCVVLRSALLNFVHNLALTNAIIDCCWSQRLSSDRRDLMQSVACGPTTPAVEVFKRCYAVVSGELNGSMVEEYYSRTVLSRYHYLCYNIVLCDTMQLTAHEYWDLYDAVAP